LLSLDAFSASSWAFFSLASLSAFSLRSASLSSFASLSCNCVGVSLINASHSVLQLVNFFGKSNPTL